MTISTKKGKIAPMGDAKMPDFEEFANLEFEGWSNATTAASYADEFGKASEIAAPVLAAKSQVGGGSEVLDVCCGHGIVSAELVKRGANVTGLDFSPAMLAMSRARVPNATFLEGDALNLPFDSGTFDAVTCGLGLPHVPDQQRAIEEAARVLKAGGRYVYSVWCGPEVDGAFAWFFKAVADFGDPGIALPPGPDATNLGLAEVAGPILDDVGFAAPDITIVESRWHTKNPAAPFDNFDRGTVRGAALLREQSAGARAAIRERIEEIVVKKCDLVEGKYMIPIPSVVVSATKL